MPATWNTNTSAAGATTLITIWGQPPGDEPPPAADPARPPPRPPAGPALVAVKAPDGAWEVPV